MRFVMPNIRPNIRPRKLPRILRRFRSQEDGSVFLIEFVIIVPLLFSSLLMSTEMGLYAVRHMFLERGLDIAVRHVRLNTSNPPTHDELKDMICEYAGFLDDCDDTLRLEMVTVNPREFSKLPAVADCVDTSQTVQPVRGYTLGQQQELMMLRACVKFDPIYPTTGLGYAMAKDGSGKATMISAAIFVQEPG